MRQAHRALAGLLLATTAAADPIASTTGAPGGDVDALAWTAWTRRRLAREPV
jgi:hypothetical protein